MAAVARETHHGTAVAKGAFWFAACTCGYDGPLRVSLALARADFASHARIVKVAHEARRRAAS